MSEMPDDLLLSGVATADESRPERFPALFYMSPPYREFAFRERERTLPEMVYVPVKTVRDEVFIINWNLDWNAGRFRHNLYSRGVYRMHRSRRFRWLRQAADKDLQFLPQGTWHNYLAHIPAYHLLPLQELKRAGLPLFREGTWPFAFLFDQEQLLPRDLDERVSRAFARIVWPLLNSQSHLSAYAESDPIRILAHNIDFWLPYLNEVIARRIDGLGRLPVVSQEQAGILYKVNSSLPEGLSLERDYYGGNVWSGEAREVLRELVELADGKGNLRAILDAVKCNRLVDDFSAKWSYAREDFERKLYCKRSKIRPTFVQLDDTIPVHGPQSEVHENLLWQDFLVLLNPKERRVVVCLRNGVTKLGDIAKELGYSNHSPISKMLARVRKKARQFIDG
jgi:hypothetical protein